MNRNNLLEQRSLLRLGIIVGPFYLIVSLIQALTREGFDLGRHSLSILANGPWGWVQTGNLILSGVMVIGAAAGIAKALRSHSRASGPLLACFGASMVIAAFFPADPVDGFPPGTPPGIPDSISTAGMVHFAAGGIGFLALAVSCITAGLSLFGKNQRVMAGVSIISGVAVLFGFAAPAIFPATGPVAGIWFSVVVGWAWLAILCARLVAETGGIAK